MAEYVEIDGAKIDVPQKGETDTERAYKLQLIGSHYLADCYRKGLVIAGPPATPPVPEPQRVKCPECGGAGVVSNPSAGNCDSQYVTCPVCHGRKYLE